MYEIIQKSVETKWLGMQTWNICTNSSKIFNSLYCTFHDNLKEKSITFMLNSNYDNLRDDARRKKSFL